MEFKYEEIIKLSMVSNNNNLPIPSTLQELLDLNTKIVVKEGLKIIQIELPTEYFLKIQNDIENLKHYGLIMKRNYFLDISGIFVINRIDLENKFKLVIDNHNFYDKKHLSDVYVSTYDMKVEI